MDVAGTYLQRPKIDNRHRRWTPIIPQDRPEHEQTNSQEAQPRGLSDWLSISKKERGIHRSTMTKDHRFYHRRQAGAATKVVTVNVEIVATVDTGGHVVGQETKTPAIQAVPTAAPVVALPSVPLPPAILNVVDSVAAPAVPPAVPVPAVPTLPQVPAVPAMPTVALPVVPSVPPFPTDLTVPAYPWPSGVSALAVQISPTPLPSAALTSVAGSVPISASVPSALSSNSTIISTSSSLSASLASGSSASRTASVSDSVSSGASSRSPSSDVNTASSQSGRATPYTSVYGTTQYGGVGGGAPTQSAVGPAANTAAAGTSGPGNTTPLQTPQVVGSVVGSLAGAALILAIILVLLRRHKRQRRGALQLTNDETTDRVPPMSQDTSRGHRIPSAFLNRFSGMSKSTIETNTSASERGFQRVSGRKLPSAFSEGMTSEQFSRGGTMSGSSFYQDDQGTYGGPSLSKEFGKEIGGSTVAAGAGTMNIRPSPARTPIIRHPDDYSNPFADPSPFPRDDSHLSPPGSPNPDAPRSTLGRSLQSADGSRSSKFTENV
jgi:hypothetical protein